MGSTFWEPIYNDHCVTQYHNGRPLSVALTEPDDLSFDVLHPSARSQSVGRRVKREFYSKFKLFFLFSIVKSFYLSAVQHPQTMFQRVSNHVGSTGDMFVEKLGKDQTQDDHRRRFVLHRCCFV